MAANAALLLPLAYAAVRRMRGEINIALLTLTISAAFLLLFMLQTPPWLVVILSAAGGALISML